MPLVLQLPAGFPVHLLPVPAPLQAEALSPAPVLYFALFFPALPVLVPLLLATQLFRQIDSSSRQLTLMFSFSSKGSEGYGSWSSNS